MRIIYILRAKLAKTSKKRYISYLRNKGIKIGKDFVIYNLSSIQIDVTRPSLVEIGDSVQINKNFTLLTHDFVSAVFKNLYSDFLPSSGKVKIGNNVAFGINCTVLKGVTIGDNCFIAAGSIVTKDIPANSVVAGIPAKRLCSIDEYYKRRKVEFVQEAKEYARSIQERFNRRPILDEFTEESQLFWNHESNINEKYYQLIRKQTGAAFTEFSKNNKPLYKSFEDFLKDCGL